MVHVASPSDRSAAPGASPIPGAGVDTDLSAYQMSPPALSVPDSRPGLDAPELQLIAKAFETAPQRDGILTSEAFTRELTRSHYENFSVISLFLPRALRQHFCNIYAFCRVADDLADELHDKRQASAALADLRLQLLACYQNERKSLLFVALGATIDRYEIPPEPFLNLIDAFEQDQRVTRYQTFEEVVDYCRRSADPVGRLVLYLSGYRDPERQRLSDKTCTALQLANFWQDVRRDALARDRIYIPGESMQAFAITESQIKGGHFTPAFGAMMRAEVTRAEALFDEGDALLPLLSGSIRRQVTLFGLGGRAILDAIRRQNYDTLTTRPVLSRAHKARLVGRVLLASLIGRFCPGARS